MVVLAKIDYIFSNDTCALILLSYMHSVCHTTIYNLINGTACSIAVACLQTLILLIFIHNERWEVYEGDITSCFR